ncbi:hypothetical protein GW17_00056273 [Ensete ventricosum]|nr:hypothetical protein GW17_00056273 [Ensete ventricosum]
MAKESTKAEPRYSPQPFIPKVDYHVDKLNLELGMALHHTKEVEARAEEACDKTIIAKDIVAESITESKQKIGTLSRELETPTTNWAILSRRAGDSRCNYQLIPMSWWPHNWLSRRQRRTKRRGATLPSERGGSWPPTRNMRGSAIISSALARSLTSTSIKSPLDASRLGI